MKIKVLVEFHDKEKAGVVYKPGQVIEFDDARAKSAIAYQLCEECKETAAAAGASQGGGAEKVAKPRKTATKKKAENDQ